LIDKKQRFLALTEEHWRSTLDHLICGRGSDSLSTPVTHAAISSIPSSWKLPPLKYLTDINRPIMYGIVLPGPNVEHGVMIVKGGDVKPERLHPDRLCKTTFEIERGYERSRLKCGDLLITIRGGIGDVEIVPPEIGGANLTQDVARIAPRFGVHSVWLRYALLAPSVFSPLEAKALGAAVRGINIFDLKCVRVPTPPIGKQIEIARRLETDALQFADLKQKIARHSVIIREFRSALITAAVTGQIDVTTWGKQGQTDRRLDQIQEAMRA
jgi:type I restriction enzyme S subunit